MVTVAVAGGTGTGIGSVIVHELLSSKKHQVVVLSRSDQPHLSSIGVITRVVDYNSLEQLTSALAGVHTVISCIWVPGPDIALPQLHLLEAAQKTGVKRFVPSDWLIHRYDEVTAYNAKAIVWDAVRLSGLEYTRFITGIWMNLFGVGSPYNEAEALSGYRGPSFLINIKEGTALLPDDGSQKVVFTDRRDVARFVAATLDLDRWEPDNFLVGDKKSYGEVLELAERITGQSFKRSHISNDEIQTMLDSHPDPGTQFFYEFKRLVAKRRLDFDGNLNQRFPEIKTLTVEEYLEKYWSGTRL
jgi:nucleoside-diphosphate-sugar epimerase